MVAEGLLEEATRLAERAVPLGRSASQSIGFKEVCEGLAAGMTREQVIERIKQGSRRLAKRQMTWFRKLPIEWIRVSGEWSALRLAEEILRRAGWVS
jgi:tRNA dimethylallyltransferase